MNETELLDALRGIVGPDHVDDAAGVREEDTHDEALTGEPVRPTAVVRPATTAEVSSLLALADRALLPVVARGSGTGLAGGARPVSDGILVCFDRMNQVLEVDEANHVAVVQPGVTLRQLDDVLRPSGFVYPVYPGEMSASLGGNVATNAGGMRAVRYGVTRHHVLGLELVLPGGQVLRTGGKFVKSSSGYDLTQLILGSEGTLALVTEVTVKLVPRLAHTATLLAPFASMDLIAAAVGPILAAGVTPLILEYIDALSMDGIVRAAGLELGVPDGVRAATAAYLVVVLESSHADRLEEDTERTAERLGALDALDVYVLPSSSGADLIAARERAFFVGKALGVDDVVDAVVPRSEIPAFLAEAARMAADHQAVISGCGHVGDGNVHFSVFQPDADRRHDLLDGIYRAAHARGGAVSGEHGLGTEKQRYWLALEDPAKIALMRRIKAAFDPNGILGPGRVFDDPVPAGVPAGVAAGVPAGVAAGVLADRAPRRPGGGP